MPDGSIKGVHREANQDGCYWVTNSNLKIYYFSIYNRRYEILKFRVNRHEDIFFFDYEEEVSTKFKIENYISVAVYGNCGETQNS